MSETVGLPFEPVPPSRPARPRRRPERRVFTVSELTAAVRTLLEGRFSQVWVEGEISNARRWTTGHLYFTLKDRDAQLKAVMFRSSVRLLRFSPENGQKVIARGRISVYDPKGEYQIVCEQMEPHGLGARQLEYEQLRERLTHEGLFDEARKRGLPALPRKIGLTTSLDGAVVRDVLQILRRRYPRAHVVIAPVRVQGEGAAGQVAAGLDQLGRIPGVDVIVVARGGGSIEDLWAFNQEVVARAVARAPVPVVSAIGHETDFTICDFVADLRAPTPSAAAELVVGPYDELVTRVTTAADRLRSTMRRRLQHHRRDVHETVMRPGLAGFPARLAGRGRHAADLAHRLSTATARRLQRQRRLTHELGLRLESLDVGRRLGRLQTRLARSRGRLVPAVRDQLTSRRTRLRAATARLEALSPLGVLARGYAVCWNGARTQALRSAREVAVGDPVRVTLHDGELTCEVKRTT